MALLAAWAREARVAVAARARLVKCIVASQASAVIIKQGRISYRVDYYQLEMRWHVFVPVAPLYRAVRNRFSVSCLTCEYPLKVIITVCESFSLPRDDYTTRILL